MKRVLLSLLCLAMLLAFASCRKKEYRADLPSTQIATHAAQNLPIGESSVVAAAHFLDDYFQIPDFVQDYEVRFCADRNNLDEFGIFRVAPEHAKEMQSLLADYLSKSLEQNRTWYDSYIPQETPKLRDAETKIFGSVVVYAVLSAPDRDVFFKNAGASG